MGDTSGGVLPVEANHIAAVANKLLIFLLYSLFLVNIMSLKSSGTTCAVRGCTYNRTKLNTWLKLECFDHKPKNKKSVHARNGTASIHCLVTTTRLKEIG